MILITGDIHNEFDKLNTLINKKNPDMVICCGDFGYWPHISVLRPLTDIKPKNSRVLWCDGNHEDHWSLAKRERDEMVPNVVYMPRGSVFTLPDGRNMLFMGGAESIDKMVRTEGRDWFREETISNADFENVPNPLNTKIDIVISHTCPEELVDTMIQYNSFKTIEPSNTALSHIWDMFKPSLWYFGHWHKYVELDMKGTKFYGLDYPGHGERWWIELK